MVPVVVGYVHFSRRTSHRAAEAAAIRSHCFTTGGKSVNLR